MSQVSQFLQTVKLPTVQLSQITERHWSTYKSRRNVPARPL